MSETEGVPEVGRGTKPPLRAGLRLQILAALAALMLLAFGLLFFAVASLARATVVAAREDAFRALGRSIADHVAAAAQDDAARIDAILAAHLAGEVEAICVFSRAGVRRNCVGTAGLPGEPLAPAADAPAGPLRLVRTGSTRALDVTTPAGKWLVVTRMRIDAEAAAPLVRLVALYMATFALALFVFAYFALTALIVQPIEQLVAAADRVASGSRVLRVPRGGARELIELGDSVRAMAGKLIAEEHRLIRKINELTAMTEQLTMTQAHLVRSERMASVGRLAAGLAHEIGNPLAALIGLTDLLLDGGLSGPEERDFLRRMRGETERIHAVVRDLLEFARPEAREAHPAAQSVAEVGAVVADVLALVRLQKPLRDVQFVVDVLGELRVAVPPAKLTQVLLNLLLNAGAAVAALEPGSAAIVVRARAVDGGERVRLEVDDNGAGVAPEVSDRLFEPFVTTKGIGQGTGLGLAVCRGIVEAAGGEVGHSDLGTGGARFYVVLPSIAASGRGSVRAHLDKGTTSSP